MGKKFGDKPLVNKIKDVESGDRTNIVSRF